MALIAIYGGSFNPVHFGHTGMAEWVLRHTPADEVWMMVSPNNPLKDKRILADEHQRLDNLRQVLHHLGDPQFSEPGRAVFQMEDGRLKAIVASDFEFALPRPNYTANTLRLLRERFPDHQFMLLIGEDNYRLFDRWREWEFILENFPVLVYPRHTASSASSEPAPPVAFSTPHAQITFLTDAPYFDISSTEIRNRQAK